MSGLKLDNPNGHFYKHAKHHLTGRWLTFRELIDHWTMRTCPTINQLSGGASNRWPLKSRTVTKYNIDGSVWYSCSEYTWDDEEEKRRLMKKSLR